MEYLVIAGTIISLIGLVGLIVCIVKATKAKREGGTQEEMQAKLEPLIPLNLGSLFLSIIGLICVVIGVMLS